MINKINNQKYYEYSKVNQQKRETTDSSEFHMNMEKQGVVYEKNEEKKTEKKKEIPREAKDQSAKEETKHGVMLEISPQGYEKSEKEKQRISLVENVRKYAERAIAFLKAFWDKVWNDNTDAKEGEFPEVLEEKLAEQGEDAVENEIPEIVGKTENSGWDSQDTIAESIYTQEEIRQIFRRGNQKEIEDFLSNHGERQLARSTDLLTQYDRKGSLVGINNSDKELILHGNKNEIKL